MAALTVGLVSNDVFGQRVGRAASGQVRDNDEGVGPGVTKVGGIRELRETATLHLLATTPEAFLIEQMFLGLEAYIHGDWNHPKGNAFTVPDGPGLGSGPDPTG